jgi:hypothetical protein
LTEVERLARRKGAEFEVVEYGQLADKPPKETDLVGLLVGERGSLTRQTARAAARAHADVVRKYPGAQITWIVSGYDADPRELPDIEFVAEHLRRIARFCGFRSVEQAMASPLHPATVGLLAKCGCWPHEVDPEDVRVVSPWPQASGARH